SSVWLFQDLANGHDAEGSVVIEQSGVLEMPDLMYINTPAVVTTAVGQMILSDYPSSCWLKPCSISILRQFLRDEGREAQNIIKVYLANMCLKGVDTDALVTAYELVVINPFSESAGTVGTRSAVSAEQAGCLPMDEVFRLAVTSFKVYDWRLFGAAS
ncbi:hypothetical protein S83_016024, partial [Arachis hypogaea]